MIFGTLGRYFFVRYMVTTFWFLLGVISIVFLLGGLMAGIAAATER